jgi:hypothetical protein
VNQFPLKRVKTHIKIDRVKSALPWGTHFFPLRSGHHDIEIGFWSWGRIAGENGISVDLVDGEIVSLVYRVHKYWAFLPGSISIV